MNIVYTCDPEVTNQLLHDRHFEKPTELLQILNIFGPTITGTSGDETRLYRRVSAPFFNKSTFRRVWTTSVASTDQMMNLIHGSSGLQVANLRQSLARLTLHILHKVAFEKAKGLNESDLIRNVQGHPLDDYRIMSNVLDNFATIFLVPSIILSEQLRSLTSISRG